MLNFNSKKLKGLLLVFSFGLVGSFFAIPSYAGDELHVCPGSGESCQATIVFDGKEVKVSSFKTKGSGAIVVIAG
jgi:hypothetical protein